MSYDVTLQKLDELFPEEEGSEGGGVPDAIKSMLVHQGAVLALGGMMW